MLYLISNKNDESKIKELLDLFDYVSDTSNFNLYVLDSFGSANERAKRIQNIGATRQTG